MFRYLLILLFIFNQATYAMTSHVRCPNIDLIHESADLLNEATFVNDAYIANSPPFAIHTHHLSWFAVVYNIQAANSNDALQLAKTSMRSVKSQDNYYALNLGGIYVCDYDGRKVGVVSNG